MGEATTFVAAVVEEITPFPPDEVRL